VNPRLLADLVVLAHFAFVLFVVLGGLLIPRWPRLAWVHLPAVVWGVVIEWSHGECPLTPLENRLREQAGESGYAGGFVDHYVMPVLYPAGLAPDFQLALGAAVLVLNGFVYAYALRAAFRAADPRRANDRSGRRGESRSDETAG